MKFLALIAMLCAVLALTACGGGDSSAEGGEQQAANTDTGQADADADTTDSEDASESDSDDAKPRVQPPSGPPPKELAVEDLEEGSGPAAEPGDELKVRFVAVDKSGKEVYGNWNEKQPFSFELGTGEFGTGWDKGLTGMKAGARRELSIPADQAFEGKRALYYVVELIELVPASEKDGAGQGGGASPAQ